MNSRWLQTRQTKYALYALLYITMVIAIVAVVNVLANRYNKSFDSTANKRYSLSDQTAKIVRGLDRPVQVTYFDQGSRLQVGKDLLDRYISLSPQIHVTYVDPDKNPQAARDAAISNYGVSVVQIGDKKEQAKSPNEEQITGAMIRAMKTTTRTICFSTGNGERQIDDFDRGGYAHLKQMLDAENYATKSINLLEKADVPAECTVVVFGGPRNDYQPSTVEAITKYIENGGRGLFLLDPPLKTGAQPVADNDALVAVLQKWGITLDKDLILDLNPVGQLAGLGPQVALVTTYGNHAIVTEMKGTATGFPLSRSMSAKSAERTSVEKLFDSSATSLATSAMNAESIDPSDPKNKKGPLTLAAAGTYQTDKEGSQGRFVVVGSSNWTANSFISFNGNSDLAMNTLNWLASDEDLISIRPKPPEDRKITMTRSQMNWVRTTSQFVLPAALFLMGVSVWWRRR